MYEGNCPLYYGGGVQRIDNRYFTDVSDVKCLLEFPKTHKKYNIKCLISTKKPFMFAGEKIDQLLMNFDYIKMKGFDSFVHSVHNPYRERFIHYAPHNKDVNMVCKSLVYVPHSESDEMGRFLQCEPEITMEEVFPE